MVCKLNLNLPKLLKPVKIFVGFKTLGTFIEFWWFVPNYKASKFFNQRLNVQKEKFVYHNYRCFSFFRPLSYHFRSRFIIVADFQSTKPRQSVRIWLKYSMIFSAAIQDKRLIFFVRIHYTNEHSLCDLLCR